MSIPVGAQLYTLRRQMQNEKGIEKTLARVAEIGYTYIQCSGFKFEAERMKALCGGLGLKVRLTHTAADRILGDTASVIREHQVLGCPYVGLGGMGGEYRSAKGARQFLKDYGPAMRAFREAGLKFQYHNHAWEFERFGGERFYDILVSESAPALLGFTLDTYWAQHGGMDVPALIRKMKGRIDVCHYKDYAVVDGQPRFAAIGDGNMNWPAVIAAFGEAGCRYAFVEQDDCYGKDPLEELAVSWNYLKGEQCHE
ncbi:MAG: sugar phosphate isomerase/epimerase [Oscillospiraceae bacterium]|jgi:sugar phosphate isomerase/epimerase|nr:sugar phosphate isomerase/epimerase [Oscillospiraceae bacterium]